MSELAETNVTYEYKVYTAQTPKVGAKDKAFHPLSEKAQTELNTLLQDGWQVDSTHTGPAGWMVFGTGFLWHLITFVLRRPV